MVQIARGGTSLATSSAKRVRTVETLLAHLRNRGRLGVVDDALVPLAHQSPHHAGTHSTQTDHSQLHCLSDYRAIGHFPRQNFTWTECRVPIVASSPGSFARMSAARLQDLEYEAAMPGR